MIFKIVYNFIVFCVWAFVLFVILKVEFDLYRLIALMCAWLVGLALAEITKKILGAQS